MTSEELNQGISVICDKDELEIDGGKCIPYVGWFWRDVDFDAPSYCFGVIPLTEEGPGFVGFMENNKWGYDYTRPTTPEEWAKIKGLLEAAVRNPTKETTQAVWDEVQKVYM